MSIQSEITRISGNVSDALDAIEQKGVTPPAGANSDNLASLIQQINNDQVFWCTYGVTTSTEINTAFNAGKELLCLNGDLIYRLTEIYLENDYAIFTAFNEINLRKYTLVCEEDSWGATYKDAAPLVSPTFTGSPKAPTATTGTNTTQIATTAFVQQEINSAASSTVPLVDAGSGSAGTASTFSRNDHQHPYPDIIHIGSSAPINTDIEFWLDTDEPGDTPVLSVNGQTGAVTLDADDVGAVAYFKIVPGNTDLNDVITSGFYRLTANYTNAPSGVDYSQMIVSRGSDTVAQVIFCCADSRVFVRTGYGIGGSSPTWVSWKEISNVQGTAQIYNPVSDLDSFYTGIGLFNAQVANIPLQTLWLVISAGVSDTRTQVAFALFNDAVPMVRRCASGTWSTWSNLMELVTSVNGQTGDVILAPSNVGIKVGTATPTTADISSGEIYLKLES